MARKNKKNHDYYYEIPKEKYERKKTPIKRKTLALIILFVAVAIVSSVYFLLLHLDETVWMINLPIFQVFSLLASAVMVAMSTMNLLISLKYDVKDDQGNLILLPAEKEKKMTKLKNTSRILAFVFIVLIVPITMDVIITFFIK